MKTSNGLWVGINGCVSVYLIDKETERLSSAYTYIMQFVPLTSEFYILFCRVGDLFFNWEKMTETYLDHFIEAHRAQFDSALTELLAGRKKSHWIWFIFPVAVGFGKVKLHNITVLQVWRKLGLLLKIYLGRNYITCIEAVMQHRADDIEIILGSRIDKWKFRASLTLFEKATFRWCR